MPVRNWGVLMREVKRSQEPSHCLTSYRPIRGSKIGSYEATVLIPKDLR